MEDIRQKFNGRGIRNEDLYGTQPTEEEKQLMQQVSSGSSKNPWEEDPDIQKLAEVYSAPSAMDYISKESYLGNEIFKQPVEDTLTPFDLGDFGRHRRERKATVRPWETEEDLMERRARMQSGWSQLFNGLGKGVITLGTTVLNGTVGMAYGIGSAIANKQFSKIWDNSITEATKQATDWAEKAMPNYYTQKELTAENWYDNFFTANFWGDKFIKNLGFTVGAFYSGEAWAAGLKLIGKGFKAAKLGKAVGKGATATDRSGRWAKVARTGREIAGISGAAVSEGIWEAKNGADEWEKLELEKANSDYEMEVARINSTYKESLAAEALNALNDYESPEAQYKNKALIKAKEDYNKRIERIKKDKARVGNVILGLNLPILATSEWIQFGRLHAGGWNPYKNFVQRHATKKFGNQTYKSLWTRLGIKENKVTDVLSVMPRGFFAEAKEEWLQRWASNYAERTATEDVDAFVKYGSRYNPNRTLWSVLGDMGDALVFTAQETGANGSWEEFFIGGITGLLGMPRFKRAFKDGAKNTKSKGTTGDNLAGKKSGLSFSFENSILKRARERTENRTLTEKYVKEANKRANEIIKAAGGDEAAVAEYLTNLTQGIHLEDYMKGIDRHALFEQEMMASAAKGDKKGYEIGRAKQLISDIILFNTVGVLDEFKEYAKTSLDENSKFTDEQIQNYIDKTTTTVEVDDGTGNKIKELRGPYVEAVAGKQQKMTVEAVRKRLKENAQQVLDTIDAVRKTSDAIQNISLGKLKEEHAEVLTFIALMRDQYLNKSMESAGELADALEDYAKFWESQRIEKSATLTEKEQKDVDRFNNYVDGVLNKISSLRDYANEITKNSSSERKLEKAKRILVGTLGSSEYRMGLLTTEQVAAILKNPIVHEAFKSHLEELFKPATDAAKFIKYAQEFNEKFNQYMADANKLDVDIEKINQQEAKKRSQQEAKSAADSILETWTKAEEEKKSSKNGVNTYTFAKFREDAKDIDIEELRKHFKDNETLLNYTNSLEQYRRVKEKAKEIMDSTGASTPVRDVVDRVLEEISVEGKSQTYMGKLKKIYKSTLKNVMSLVTAEEKDKAEMEKQALAVIDRMLNDIKKEDEERKKAQQKQGTINPGGKPVNPVSTSISGAVTSLLEKFDGKTFDIRDFERLFAGYDDSTLKAYKETLEKATSADKKGLTDLELKYKDILIGTIDSVFEERAEKPEVEIDERKEKEGKKELEKKQEERQSADESIAPGTLRSHDLSYYNPKSGKDYHEKTGNPDRQPGDVLDAMEATKAQEAVDSGIIGYIFNTLAGKGKKISVKMLTSEHYPGEYVLALDLNDLQALFKSLSLNDKFQKAYDQLSQGGFIITSDVNGTKSEIVVLGHLGVVGYGDRRWAGPGILDRSTSKEFQDAGKLVTNSKSKTDVDIQISGQPIRFVMHNDATLEIDKIYSGRFEKTANNVEQDLRNLKPVGGRFTYGIVLSNRDVLGEAHVTMNPYNKTPGMVVITTRGADGEDYPVPITVKHFSKNEFPVDDDTNALTKKVKELVKAIVEAGDNGNVNEVLKQIRALRKLLYFGNYELHFDIVSPRVNNGKLEYGIVLKMADNSSGKREIKTISPVGKETKEEALFRSLVEHDLRIYVNGSDTGTMSFEELVDAGAFSTNVESLNNFNGSFTLSIPGRQPVKPVTPVPTPGPATPSNTPSIIKWNGYIIRPDGSVAKPNGNPMTLTALKKQHPTLGITYEEVFNILRSVMDPTKKHEELLNTKGQSFTIYEKTTRTGKELFAVSKKNGKLQIEAITQDDYEKLKKENEEQLKKRATGQVPVAEPASPAENPSPAPAPSGQQSQVDKAVIDNLNKVTDMLVALEQESVSNETILKAFDKIYDALEAFGFAKDSFLITQLKELVQNNISCMKFTESREEVREMLRTISDAYTDDTKQVSYQGISMNQRNLKDAANISQAVDQLTNSLRCFYF